LCDILIARMALLFVFLVAVLFFLFVASVGIAAALDANVAGT